VAQAAAIAMDAGDDKRLVGYVVGREAQQLDPQDLQHYVRQKLPEYMVPWRLVVLEHLPRTSSGKIDRLALPVPPPLAGQTGMPPRNELEQQLASMWEELLDVRHPGIQDDFFTMGGHSLLALRLLGLIRQRCGTELPLATLLQAPTIASLAEILRGDTPVRDFTHAVALHRGTQRPFFCVPGVGGTVFYLLKLADLLGRDQAFYGLQARGIDGATLPYTSVEEMAGHYVQAIQTVQPAGPYLLGGHSFGGHVAFEMAIQLEAMGHEVEELVLIDCPAPMALHLTRPWTAAAIFLGFATILGIDVKNHPDLVRTLLRDIETDAKLAVLYEAVMQLDAFPLHVAMDQFRGVFQVYLLNCMMQYAPPWGTA
jgi:surfactin synthase thioesterase subunit